MQSDGERIAANTEAIRGLRHDVQEGKQALDALVVRFNELKEAVDGVRTERQTERRVAKARQDAIQTWLRILTVAITLGGVLMSAAFFIATWYFHK